ncbi:hypothetical protein DPX16_20442 [Anabarilius grahami]|uniref:Uncharacterized protein n=1 Tax=Anabarilius grahami TaxID=495550 RepID=A0A3N0Z4Y5_ANAGA|nr:hypothetical protein DPX16_20442 [Anabarilius grahami]
MRHSSRRRNNAGCCLFHDSIELLSLSTKLNHEEETLMVLMSVQMILILWNSQTEGSLDSEVSADPGSLEHADLEDL